MSSNREEIEAEANNAAATLTEDITLIFGENQLELINKIVAKAYITGKCKAKLEELEGVLK